MTLAVIDQYIIRHIQRYGTQLARWALFIVFVWFGSLKLFGISPASDLVEALLFETMAFVPFEGFMLFLGFYEVIIGASFLIPRFERIAILLLLVHMLTTFFPLIFLPDITWQHMLVPTLEGQYILKNVVIVALALGVAAHLRPMKKKGKQWKLA